MPSLESLGWTERVAALFAGHADAGLIPARVSLEHTHIYRVMTGDEEVLRFEHPEPADAYALAVLELLRRIA